MTETVAPLAAGSAVADPVSWPGLDGWETRPGWARVGVHGDGGPAEWALCVPGWGTPSGFVTGAPGSGVSGFLRAVAVTAAYTGVFSVWAADPDGLSAPGLTARAGWAATGRGEIGEQLRCLSELVDERLRAAAEQAAGVHVPSAAEPGVLLLVERFGEVAGDAEHQALLARILRNSRKAGVAVVGADRSPALGAFGGSEPLRTALFATNVAVFRTSNTSRSLVPRLAGDPSQLPQWFADGSPAAGIGYLANDQPEPFRGWWIPEADTDRLLAYAPPAASWRPTPAADGSDVRAPQPSTSAIRN